MLDRVGSSPSQMKLPLTQVNKRNRDKNTTVLPGIDSKVIVVRRTDAR